MGVHFDAHPDLGAPMIPADDVFDPQELYHHLRNDEGGIASWILPIIYAGHLSHLFLFRPPWAPQMEDGNYPLMVGPDEEGGTLKVDCAMPYFVEDGIYAAELLESKKGCELTVSL